MKAMQVSSFIEAPCVVCGEHQYEIICSATEVAAQIQYLRHFHHRRLRLNPRGEVPSEALAERANFTQDYLTDIGACTRCGVVFRTPRPSERTIAWAYKTDHYHPTRLVSLFIAHHAFYRTKAALLHRWLPRDRPVSVVEVGSFVGGFLAAGHERGWHMLGVDPGAEVALFCQQRGLHVFQGTLAEAPLQPGTVDCVAIWNTFDQLPSPASTLAAIREVLRPNGLVVIRVPNGACFRWALKWMPRLPPPFAGWLRATLAWNNLLAFPYLYGYSVSTLDLLLADYGFMRLTAHPDTLVSLADQQTKRWAVQEERLLKCLCMLTARLSPFLAAGPAETVPWVDVYYQRVLEGEKVSRPVIAMPLLSPLAQGCVAS